MKVEVAIRNGPAAPDRVGDPKAGRPLGGPFHGAAGRRPPIVLLPEGREEVRPYHPAPHDDWSVIRRFFTPPPVPTTYHTREGVYGVTARGPTSVAEPPGRDVLMRAALGDRVVARGTLHPGEVPHGATLVGSDVSFVVHAPHAAWAGLSWSMSRLPAPSAAERSR
jgi:hypothetical protein